MSATQIWIERNFNFDFDSNIYPDLINRLKSVIEKYEECFKTISKEVLIQRYKNKWSIQENIGHLYLTDKLFIGRFDDYLSSKKFLRPADLSGDKTDKENFNEKDITEIFQDFKQQRKNYIQRLIAADEKLFARVSIHPRLNKPMRLCDMLYFQVEHDDHHLLKIKNIKEALSCTKNGQNG